MKRNDEISPGLAGRARMLGRLAAVAALLLFVVASAGPAMAALECTSDLTMSVSTFATACGLTCANGLGNMPGATVQVTLTVESGPSRDILDIPVEQQFDKITFFPSCIQGFSCVVDSALPVSFVGPVSTDCPVSFPWFSTQLGGGTQIEFTFPPTPPALTLPAAVTPIPGTTTCQLVFNVLIDPSIDPASLPKTVIMEANTSGVCDPGGLALTSAALTTTAILVDMGPLENNGDISQALSLGPIKHGPYHLRSRIGDGLYGSAGTGSGDYDFFSIPGLNAGWILSVDVSAGDLGSALDSVVVVYDSAGVIVGSNNDSVSASSDSFLEVTLPADGDYFIDVHSFFADGLDVLTDPFDSTTGPGVGSEGDYELTISVHAVHP